MADEEQKRYTRRSVLGAMAVGAVVAGAAGVGATTLLDDDERSQATGAEGLASTVKIDRTAVAPLARSQHATALLEGGLVLCIGGLSPSGTLASCQVYDPEKNEWYDAAPLSRPRSFHSATPLGDGKVLVLGGLDGNALATASVFDPATDSWSPMKSLETPRYNHAATPLPDGRVVLTGGINLGALAGAEIYQPT